MSFELTEEQEMLKKNIQAFMTKECPKESVRALDEKEQFPREIFNRLSRLGVTGLTVPEEYGGAGTRIASAIVVLEEISRKYAALGWVYVMCAFYGGENINKIGSEHQKQLYLPGISRGDTLFAYGLTEPNAGSDLAMIQSKAVNKGSDFILSGGKAFITGANEADYILALLRTDGAPPSHEGLSMFIIDAKSEGLVFRPIKKLGYKGSHACEIFFEDTIVPSSNVVGGPECLGQGWQLLLMTLDTERLEMAACGVGVAQGALDEATEYAKNRIQFGKPISKLQVIRHMLAEMATEIQAARLLTYNAAYLTEINKPSTLECNMAKYYATEVAKHVALQGLQIFGGYGYCMEYDIQRYVRDALVLPIGGGTTQVVKNNIASLLDL